MPKITNLRGRASAPIDVASTRGSSTSTPKPSPKVDKRHGLDADSWAEANQWVNVKSSNVAAIKYDWQKGKLHVRFNNGAEYIYDGVAKHVAKMMFTTTSMGKFVHRVLRDRYPTEGPL